MIAGRRLFLPRTGWTAALAAALTAFTVPALPDEIRPRLKIPNSQIEPVAWPAMEGWVEDDHGAAFKTFMASCRPILRGTPAMRKARPVYGALYEACRAAVAEKPATAAEARAFFERHFRPVAIAPLGEPEGFVTGYYEPIFEGSRVASNEFTAPVRRKPSTLLKGGRMAVMGAATRKGAKKGKRVRRLVPFHDRAAIEQGALDGRNLEICYLKDPVDAFFAQIQGSVRVRLENGKMLRLNYEAQNGHPYTAVGRFLIERKHVPKEEMSMQRIREWMLANPEEAAEIRRLNKSYVFFRETDLSENEEAIGAQGISLAAWRSIAVDRNLHVYGTPFFISANLPIDGDQPTTPFRRLMIAQDTGGAIIGPARADIYFGAGDRAGEIAGRLRHPAKFVMLVPNALDPRAVEKNVPLPQPRPVFAKVDAKPAAKSDGKPAETTAKPGAKPKADAKPGAKPSAKPKSRRTSKRKS